MGRADDPRLYAQSEDTSAVCDPLRRGNRDVGDGRFRTTARSAVSVYVHNANGSSSEQQLVPGERPVRSADQNRAALQSAGADRGRVRARELALRTAPMETPGVERGSARAHGRARGRGIRPEGRRGRSDGNVPSDDADVRRVRVGSAAVPGVAGHGRPRNDRRACDGRPPATDPRRAAAGDRRTGDAWRDAEIPHRTRADALR